jgi:cytochrome P450
MKTTHIFAGTTRLLNDGDMTFSVSDFRAGLHTFREPTEFFYIVAAVLSISFSLFWATSSANSKRTERLMRSGAQPMQAPPSRSWFQRLKLAREMTTLYESGTRNQRLLEQFQERGTTFKTTAMGCNRIFTIDPTNLKAVFGGSWEDWGVQPVRFEAFRPLVSEGVLIMDGHAWRTARNLAQNIIDRILRAYSSDLTELDSHIDNLLDNIGTGTGSVDLQPLFYQYTMDVSTNNIFGESIQAMERGQKGIVGKRFLDAFVHCLKMAGERDEVPRWFHRIYDYQYQKSCRIVHDCTDKYLRNAIDLNTPRLKDEILQVQWAHATNDRVSARNHILNVLAASFDTGAILLTNAFFFLSRDPVRYAKLRGEAMAFNGVPDSHSIKSLTYLQAVLNETLRLHGPASFNSRVALRDTTIPKGGGKEGAFPAFVGRGDIVIVCLYALQRDSAVFGADADSFRPERWDTVRPKHWDFMPFSGGPRVCPGQKLALLQAAYTMFRLCRCISKLENRDTVLAFVEDYRVATGSRNGAKVAVTLT